MCIRDSNTSTPTSGSTMAVIRDFISSTFHSNCDSVPPWLMTLVTTATQRHGALHPTMYRERQRVFLRIGRIEYDAIKECLLLHVFKLGRYAHVFHCFQIDVLAHDLVHDARIVRRALHPVSYTHL